MLSLFGFGKRRRKTSRKTHRKGGSHHKKPPTRLLKICKKYRVKATRKVGGKRVYKPVKVLAKACLKKALAAAKKKKAHRKTGRKTTRHRVRRRSSSMFGQDMMKPGCGSTSFGGYASGMEKKGMMFGNQMSDSLKGMMFGNQMPFVKQSPSFGKRRNTGKVSRTHAMKAFRAFYKRHCAGMRRSRFGGGGNPPLSMNMGYEFCPSGMGGVLGAGSTGLFPSPCTSMNMGQAQAEANLSLPAYSSSGIGDAATSSQLASYANMFGRRRKTRRRTAAFGADPRRKTAIGARRRKRRSTAVGSTRKRRSTALGSTRKRRSTAVGARRKRRVRRSVY